MNTYIRIFLYCVVCGIVIIPQSLFAAELFFEPRESLYYQDTLGRFSVYINTEGDSVNTVSGTVVVNGVVTSNTVLDGNSSILFWLEKPTWDADNHTISFSGITPGGFSGKRVFLFSFDIVSPSSLPLNFSFDDISVLAHDGNGTEISASALPFTVELAPSTMVQDRNLPQDTEPPEDFVPIITRNEYLYDGKYVAVFATQDKGSGIAMYQVREGLLGRFKEVESPYVLRNQNRTSMLVVRAIDKSGNMRNAVVHPQGTLMGEYGIVIILAILSVLIFFIIRRYRR